MGADLNNILSRMSLKTPRHLTIRRDAALNSTGQESRTELKKYPELLTYQPNKNIDFEELFSL